LDCLKTRWSECICYCC